MEGIRRRDLIFIVIALILSAYLVKEVLGEKIESFYKPTYRVRFTLLRPLLVPWVIDIMYVEFERAPAAIRLARPLFLVGYYDVEAMWEGPKGTVSSDRTRIALAPGERKEVELFLIARDGPGLYKWVISVWAEDGTLKGRKEGWFEVVVE